MHKSSPSSHRALPLAGKRLLDFSQGVAGPSCAMLLGELGAEVIKVEPHEGDWVRGVGSLVQPHESSAHMSLNRNKRSICLDLKHEGGREIAFKLASRSHIVVQNFRRGVMEKFGLGYEQLSADNTELIYASIFGYGEEGPLADAPATDSVMQAFGGLMSINGDGEDTPPLRMGNMVSDMLAGSYLSQGVLAAMLVAQNSGYGQRVNVSLLDALMAFQSPPLMEYAVTHKLPQRSGRNHPMIAPSGTYAVKDGFVTLVATHQLWHKFCLAIEMPHIEHDIRFASAEARLAHRAELQALLIPFFEVLSKDEVLLLSKKYDLVCAPINDYESLISHEQVVANGIAREWTHSGIGSFFGIRNPIRYSALEPIWGPPPKLGEHTNEILALDLGYLPWQIDELKSCGAITSNC